MQQSVSVLILFCTE